MDAAVQLSNIEAERIVLGGLLMGGYATSSVTQILTAEDFLREAHAIVYQIILDMLAENEPVELPSVVSKIIQSKKSDKVGGTNYVASLIGQTASTFNLDYYGALIKEASKKRQLLKAVRDIEQQIIKDELNISDMFELAEKKIFDPIWHEGSQNNDGKNTTCEV